MLSAVSVTRLGLFRVHWNVTEDYVIHHESLILLAHVKWQPANSQLGHISRKMLVFYLKLAFYDKYIAMEIIYNYA